MKEILIINGNSSKEGFCFALAESYRKGAERKGATCKVINLTDLKFNPILTYGYSKISELEPDLIEAQKDIMDATHLVFVYPNWWSTHPRCLRSYA